MGIELLHRRVMEAANHVTPLSIFSIDPTIRQRTHLVLIRASVFHKELSLQAPSRLVPLLWNEQDGMQLLQREQPAQESPQKSCQWISSRVGEEAGTMEIPVQHYSGFPSAVVAHKENGTLRH